MKLNTIFVVYEPNDNEEYQLYIHKEGSARIYIKHVLNNVLSANLVCKTIADELDKLGRNSKSKTAFESIRQCKNMFKFKITTKSLGI